jgi:hypothetical protein
MLSLKMQSKIFIAASVVAAAGAVAYKTLSHNPQILISCTNEETFIYTPKEKKLLFVRFANHIYNEEMLATEIDGIVYAQMGNDTMGRAGFAFNRKTKMLVANFDKNGKDIGSKEAECNTKKLN